VFGKQKSLSQAMCSTNVGRLVCIR